MALMKHIRSGGKQHILVKPHRWPKTPENSGKFYIRQKIWRLEGRENEARQTRTVVWAHSSVILVEKRWVPHLSPLT